MSEAIQEQVRRLFAECLECAPADRSAFLERSGAGPEVRAEVESLLVSHEGAGAFLDTLDKAKAASLVDTGTPAKIPERVGAYRLIREIGRGGMGVVYLAERADGQFEQQVALKLVKRGMDSDAIEGRFLLERQILARLQHPNIARLLDGGVSHDGQPYFAMEYVDGTPLIDHCDRQRLSVDERLGLFRDVCRAVRYAHQQLVVHRDLKPSNILVTPSGEVKLLDFGIAKLLEADDAGGATLTEIGMRPMTPEYASPEQIRGEPITTGADVYALGVILYQLLSGRRPFDLEDRSLEAVERAIVRTEAARPSVAVTRTTGSGRVAGTEQAEPEVIARARATTPARLRRRILGDLDTIVLKAMHKQPDRRFQSVDEFLDDLERHTTGLPVRARPDTVGYRVKKYLARHVLAVTTFSLVFVSLAGGLGTALWQRGVARQEAAKAAEVQEFLAGIFEVSDPGDAKGEAVTAREILERGAERVATDLTGQPEIQAEMMALIGRLFNNLGLYERSVTQYEQALDLRRSLHGDEHVEVARVMQDQASVMLDMADYERAEPRIRDALAMQRRLLGDEHLDVARGMNALGLLLAELGQYEEAQDLLRQSVAVQRKLSGNEHPSVITALSNLGLALRWGGDFEAGEAIHREALELTRRVHGNEHPKTAWALERLGVGMAQRGELDGAEPLLREGLQTMRTVLGDDHPDTALAQNNLAKTLWLNGKATEAEPLWREALATNVRIHGEESRFVATNLANLGEVLVDQGKYAEGIELHRRSVRSRRQLMGESHPDLARGLHFLAYAQMLNGELESAESLYREAHEIGRQVWKDEHPYWGAILAGYGELLLERGRAAEAEPLLREALRVRETVLVDGHWERAEASALLGDCLLRLGQTDDAGRLLRESHAQLRADRGADHRATRRAAAAVTSLDQLQP